MFKNINFILKKIENHNSFLKYLKNMSWLFAEKILRILIGLFVSVWVVRYLGPDKFGLLSYAQNFVGIFSSIAALGLDGIVVREFVKNKNLSNNLIGTVFFLKLSGAIIIFPILFFAIQFTNNDTYTNHLIFIIASGILFQSFNIIDLYFQSKVLSKYVVCANVISLCLSSIIKIIFILNKVNLINFVWLVLFDNIVLATTLVIFFRRGNSTFIKKYKFKIILALSLLKDSWPLIFSGIAVSIYMRIDQVMIKELIDTHAVGIYAAAVRVSELWYFIPLAIVSSLLPAIVNAKKQSQELYLKRIQKLYDLMVWLAVAIALPMTCFSNLIMELLFGNEYKGSGEILMIHIWSGVFVFIGLAFGRYLLVENQTKKSLYRTVFGVIVNIILNYLLIPTYGIKGAAIATLISQISANYLYDIIDKDLHQQLKMKTKSLVPVHIIGQILKYYSPKKREL